MHSSILIFISMRLIKVSHSRWTCSSGSAGPSVVVWKKTARADPGPVTCADVLMRHASPPAPVADTPPRAHKWKWDPKWELWRLEKHPWCHIDIYVPHAPYHIQVRVHMWAETCSQTTHQGQQKGGGQEVDSHRVHGSGRIQEKIHKWHVCPCVCVCAAECLSALAFSQGFANSAHRRSTYRFLKYNGEGKKSVREPIKTAGKKEAFWYLQICPFKFFIKNHLILTINTESNFSLIDMFISQFDIKIDATVTLTSLKTYSKQKQRNLCGQV